MLECITQQWLTLCNGMSCKRDLCKMYFFSVSLLVAFLLMFMEDLFAWGFFQNLSLRKGSVSHEGPDPHSTAMQFKSSSLTREMAHSLQKHTLWISVTATGGREKKYRELHQVPINNAWSLDLGISLIFFHFHWVFRLRQRLFFLKIFNFHKSVAGFEPARIFESSWEADTPFQ